MRRWFWLDRVQIDPFGVHDVDISIVQFFLGMRRSLAGDCRVFRRASKGPGGVQELGIWDLRCIRDHMDNLEPILFQLGTI